MKLPNKLMMVIVVCLVSQTALCADQSVAAMLLDAAKRNMEGFDSVSFRLKGQVERTDFARSINPRAVGHTGAIDFAARGNKYYYREELVDQGTGKVRALDRAFDGENYQNLNHQTGTLLVTKNDPDHNHFNLGVLSPFLAYGFLAPFSDGVGFNVDWQSLHGGDSFSRMLRTAPAFRQDTTESGEVVVASFNSDPIRSWKTPIHVEVVFSKEHDWFPVKYTFATMAGKPLIEFEATALGEVTQSDGRRLVYAKEATFNVYDYAGSGKLNGATRFTVGDMQLNKIKDESMFTIDPVTARTIWDKDADVAIPIPR